MTIFGGRLSAQRMLKSTLDGVVVVVFILVIVVVVVVMVIGCDVKSNTLVC